MVAALYLMNEFLLLNLQIKEISYWLLYLSNKIKEFVSFIEEEKYQKILLIITRDEQGA